MTHDKFTERMNAEIRGQIKGYFEDVFDALKMTPGERDLAEKTYRHLWSQPDETMFYAHLVKEALRALGALRALRGPQDPQDSLSREISATIAAATSKSPPY